jgi:GNAT superfamily N-acetyltransferase
MGQAVRQVDPVAAQSVTIRELVETDREATLEMYRSFDPLGAAQGLPPVSEQGRHEWISNMLADAVNFGAFDEADRFVGHVILAPSGPAEMEVAFFVHQNFRRRRVGTKLLSRAVAHASSQGAKRLWTSVTSENVPSLRLLRGQRFKAASFTVPSLDLELLLG